MEWFVIASAIFNIIPKQYFSKQLDIEAQRHLAALTLLISFMQVYLLGVRVAPNTALPLYINMFVTVLKSYTFILMYFLAFIVSFAYTFFLIFGYNRDLLLAKTSNSSSSSSGGSTLVLILMIYRVPCFGFRVFGIAVEEKWDFLKLGFLF